MRNEPQINSSFAEHVSSWRTRRAVMVATVLPWLVLPLMIAACSKQPTSLRIKAPRDLTGKVPAGAGTAVGAAAGVESDDGLPVFTKRGVTAQLRVSAYDKDGLFMEQANVTWSSSDPSVANVDDRGLVTIAASGKAIIKATGVGYAQPLEATIPMEASIVGEVRIIPPEGGAKLGATLGATLHLGEVTTLRAEVLDDRGRLIPDAKVRWRTSDFAATVMPNGEVEGRAVGQSAVFAQAGEKWAQVEVKVLDWKK